MSNEIKNEAHARAWLAAWNGRPRIGVLNTVVSGLETALSIMNAAPQRYTIEERLNTLKAIACLKFAH